MRSTPAGLALAVSLVAVGVATYALTREPPGTLDLERRIDALTDRLVRIEETLAARRSPGRAGPALLGLGGRAAESPADAAAASPAGSPAPAGTPSIARTPGSPEALKALVNEAVAKKAAEMQVMRNKKPSIDLFAKTLALTPAQRLAAEENVVAAQRDIKTILEIPAEDGTNFMDELVEVLAHGMARPGKEPGRGLQLFGRLLSEKVPGTDQTYAARIEGVKQSLRATFRRDWTPKQYAAFEAWQMDPTEVQGVPGSPWKDVEARVVERAKALGGDDR